MACYGIFDNIKAVVSGINAVNSDLIKLGRCKIFFGGESKIRSRAVVAAVRKTGAELGG